MENLVEKRWTKFGHDRVYVSTPDGVRVGHVDITARATVVENPDFEQALADARDRWCPEPESPPPLPDDIVAAPSSDEAWAADPWSEPVTAVTHVPDTEDTVVKDLNANVAGAAVWEKRNEVNAEAPVLNLVARALGVKTEERSWRVGAKGEEKVGSQLAKLGEGWHAIHAVPVGDNGSDIDHVLIGPPGVFTINTKRHPRGKAWIGERAILVNGHKTQYLRNSRFEARRATQLLSSACGFPVSVTSMIVFVDLEDYTIKQMPADVHVINRLRLVKMLRRLPETLDSGTVESIFAKARMETTWQPPTPD